MIRIYGNSKDVKLTQIKFPDNTPKFTLEECDGEEYLVVAWFYESMEELFSLICIRKHFPKKQIKLFMPYIPNARMDRTKIKQEVFTLKHFCEIINYLNFEEVVVVDPHSDVSAALINNIKIVDNKEFIKKTICEIETETGIKPMLFFPDAGASKRYSNLSELTKIAGYANKIRDWETGKIKGLEVFGEVPKDIPILIVDDICSYGGTFYHTAKKLKEIGVSKVYLSISHCENSVLSGDLIKSDLVEKIYTLPTIFTGKHEKVNVIEFNIEV